jgi:ABC-type polysaccharide/polyol phosphate transport system ATPase subunit
MLRAHGRGYAEARLEALDLIALAELTDKTYLPYNSLSTGMRARLGFFLATINQPEILLMDEMLSVADTKFKARAEETVSRLMSRAHAVVMASHSASTIRETCHAAVVLEKGSVIFSGSPADALDLYATRGGRG